MTVRFKRLHPEAVIPAYAHAGDAGMDLRSVADLIVPARGRCLVPTGLAILLPDEYEAQVRPRSGLALNAGVSVLNSPGTIDSGYRGEIGVILYNSSDSAFPVKKGDRIAQLVIAPVTRASIVEVDDAGVTERGTDGFGSTGVV